jgi:release factor glutamine methyltransferase
LDIGTGSGCIPIAIKKNRPMTTVYALDISKDALMVAQENALQNQCEIAFIEEDIFKATEVPTTFDIIISNPPYVLKSEAESLHPNVLKYEPHLALFVEDTDAIVYYKAIEKFARQFLKPNGQIYFEGNPLSLLDVRKYYVDKEYSVEIIKDLNGRERFLRVCNKLKIYETSTKISLLCFTAVQLVLQFLQFVKFTIRR